VHVHLAPRVRRLRASTFLRFLLAGISDPRQPGSQCGIGGDDLRARRSDALGVKKPMLARQHRYRGPVLALCLAASLILVGCGKGNGASDTGNVAVTRDDNGPVKSLSASPPPTEAPTITVTATAPSSPSRQNNAAAGSCNGTIGAKAVDEVNVPDGATCTLQGTRVDGNVSVGVGATLIARGVSVDGDVEAEGARNVEVTGRSSIGGNLQLQQGRSATVSDTGIDGDLKWEGQTGRLKAQRNRIGGNLQADANNGGLSVSGNRIDGDLQCEQNNPLPTGGHNAVSGNNEDQCANL
jgi:hypothetical protein